MGSSAGSKSADMATFYTHGPDIVSFGFVMRFFGDYGAELPLFCNLGMAADKYAVYSQKLCSIFDIKKYQKEPKK